MVSVKIYVEGAGYSALDAQCRQGFQELLKKAGFRGRLPRIIPCGPRNDAFDKFKSALQRDGEYPILLVDSEEVVANANQPDANPSGGAWRHLAQRDQWQRPSAANDDQAQLMVTTMETWLLADRQALVAYFPDLNDNSLPADFDLESRRKADIVGALQKATKPSSATKSSSKGYDKGNHSFDLLGRVNPDELKRGLPHFRRFIETLERRLPK